MTTVNKTDQYKCQSYYDDNNVLQDCTCGKCAEPTPSLDSSKNEIWNTIESYVPDLSNQIGWGTMDSLCDGLHALIIQESDKAVEAFAAELKGRANSLHAYGLSYGDYTEVIMAKDIDQALIERTKK